MLFNGPQRTVRPCCLPQSPILGDFATAPAALLDRYEAALTLVPRTLNAACRQQGLSHPCAMCDKFNGYRSTVGSGRNTFAVADALALAG